MNGLSSCGEGIQGEDNGLMAKTIRIWQTLV